MAVTRLKPERTAPIIPQFLHLRLTRLTKNYFKNQSLVAFEPLTKESQN
jgi:hypothetical protein